MKVLVRSGDSLMYYSELFNLPLQLILDANPEITPEAMNIGDEVLIPGYEIKPYTVKKGDTFYKIAQGRNTAIDALNLLNPDLHQNQLEPGQFINDPEPRTTPVVNPQQMYDYNVMMQDIQKLLDLYPFLKYNIIGNSVLNRPIPEIRIGSGSKRLHNNASFHANEWITTPVLMYFLNNYALAVTNQTQIRGIDMNELYQQTDLSIVPMVNPDGVNLVINGPPAEEPYHSLVIEINNGSTDFSDWKANIRGVDLNLQFPADWELEKERGPEGPAPENYPGPYPL